MDQGSATTFEDGGIDAIALKPTEHQLHRANQASVDILTIDFEGVDNVPPVDTLLDLSATHDVRVTVPVRADGFDPLGEDSLLAAVPDDVDTTLVAGNPAYLAPYERRRAIAPRLLAAVERVDGPWIGTEGIERLALAIGGTQYELLSPGTERTIGMLREAGVTAPFAVYAPTVLTTDEAAILDAVGEYVARREPIREQLQAEAPTDNTATGHTREVLLEAAREYALVGDPTAIEDRIDRLRDTGVETIVSYPADGLDALLE